MWPDSVPVRATERSAVATACRGARAASQISHPPRARYSVVQRKGGSLGNETNRAADFQSTRVGSGCSRPSHPSTPKASIMDHLFDDFSKSLAEPVPRRESLRRLGAVFAGALLTPLGLGVASAGGYRAPRRDP